MIVSGHIFFLLITRLKPLQTCFFDNFGKSKEFHTVLTKIRAVKSQKMLKIALLLFQSFH